MKLLSLSNLGLHLEINPAGTYSFVGSATYDSQAQAMAAFVAWFKALPIESQREHAAHLELPALLILATRRDALASE